LTSPAPVPTIAGGMHRQGRDLAVGLLALAMLCVLSVPTAGAHPRDPGPGRAPFVTAQPIDSAPPTASQAPDSPPADVDPTANPLAFAAVLAGALLLGLRAVRRPLTTMRVLLALLVVLGATESAIHSVHHFASPQGGAKCQVLTITQQLHGWTSPELPNGVPVAEFRAYAATDESPDAMQSVRRPDDGRAPPSPLV